MVRTVSRRSLKVAPKKSENELNKHDRKTVAAKMRAEFQKTKKKKFEGVHSRGGRFVNIRGKPVKPLKRHMPRKRSRPEQVPYITYRQSPLKRLIYFGFDLSRNSVVVGPNVHGQRGAEEIEETRPFMRPALAVVSPQLPALLRDSV